ncbi:MAG: AVAST type 1 anti-phage system protein Avs1c [Luteolibacter sp.]
MEKMNTPLTRGDFERNFNLLRQQLDEGKMQFPIDYPMDSLLRIRLLPNGRLNLLSIDEMARINANTAGHFTKEFFEGLKEFQGQQEPLSSNESGEPEV